jgi:hypothetical protein
MEPIKTTVMISTIVGYLAKKLKDNKSIHDFLGDFTEATVKWIRPIFLTDEEKPKEVLEDLSSDPSEKINADAAEIAIAKALKKDPDAEAILKTMFDTIKSKESAGETIHIVNSKNVVTGTIKAGGNVTIGDTTTYNQTHSGSGDNVAGSKYINGDKE